MPAPQHKPGQAVVGFNHNLNYKGRVFHFQTEDLGPAHGQIITHSFMGGNILASTKSSYADLLPTLNPGDIFATVRKLMEDQHKAMMRALTSGTHDAEIERRVSPVYEPGVLAGGSKAPGLLIGGDQAGGDKVAPPKPSSLPPAARPAPPPVTPAAAPQQTQPQQRPVSGPMASSLMPRKSLATGAVPPPPVMVPSAISMVTPVPPRRAPVAPHPPPSQSRTLDELILAYLASTSDGY